jgi:aryl-alcohol dehydrogenase-like predicted oxidoreductase
MKTRKLGFTDLHLTTIGFGAWAVGGPWDFGWGPQDDAESIATIQRALDLGINWIDTAAAYGLGHSEEVVGQAIKGRRDSVIVATKCALAWDEESARQRKVFNRLKAWSVRQEAENSLRRLGVDVIDLYQIHWPNPAADVEEGWGEIARLIKEGKVRYGGVSNFNVSQLKRIQAIHPVASLQPPYSLVARETENELLSYCASNQIGVVAYSPMGSGLLTGKFTPERIAALPSDDMRHKNGHFREPELTPNLQLIEDLRPIAARSSHTVGQLAVAWVLRRPEVTAAIVGARRPNQVDEIAPAADWQLSEEDIVAIDVALAARQRTLAHA